MAAVVIDAETVTVTLSTIEKIEALHGNVTVPRSAVTCARVVADGMGELHGMRVGTGIPGVLVAGTMRSGTSMTFAVCRARRPAIVIELTGQPYDKLVITTDDAEALAARLATR